jgi:hypothetical protein
MMFSYWKQPAWAPRWRGGRLPRKLKKRFDHNGFHMEPLGFRDGYTYPGHPDHKPLVITSDSIEMVTFSSFVDVHIGKRIGGRWKPRHVWSETR